MNSARYDEGLKAAQRAIAKGEDPQNLFMQAECSPDYDDFDKGWQQACLEAGAKGDGYPC